MGNNWLIWILKTWFLLKLCDLWFVICGMVVWIWDGWSGVLGVLVSLDSYHWSSTSILDWLYTSEGQNILSSLNKAIGNSLSFTGVLSVIGHVCIYKGLPTIFPLFLSTPVAFSPSRYHSNLKSRLSTTVKATNSHIIILLNMTARPRLNPPSHLHRYGITPAIPPSQPP